MKIKPATRIERGMIMHAISELRHVRQTLNDAGATKAAKAVSRALKSAEGALRHVERRIAAGERKIDPEARRENADRQEAAAAERPFHVRGSGYWGSE